MSDNVGPSAIWGSDVYAASDQPPQGELVLSKEEEGFGPG